MALAEQKKLLAETVAKLVSLGEDKDELWFWQQIFETMDETARQSLLENLANEASRLEK